MSNKTLSIKINDKARWALNVVFSSSDTLYELKYPFKSAVVIIPSGQSRPCFVNIVAEKKTKFSIYYKNRLQFKGETDKKNMFSDYIQILNKTQTN